jgi:hypothetical protein
MRSLPAEPNLGLRAQARSQNASRSRISSNDSARENPAY